jgi:hypothetical protein
MNPRPLVEVETVRMSSPGNYAMWEERENDADDGQNEEDPEEGLADACAEAGHSACAKGVGEKGDDEKDHRKGYQPHREDLGESANRKCGQHNFSLLRNIGGRDAMGVPGNLGG